MIGALRLFRGVCGFVFGLQVVDVASVLVALIMGQTAQNPGKFLAIFLMEVIVLVISGALFFGLRKLINYLYERKHGIPHPALEKKWAI